MRGSRSNTSGMALAVWIAVCILFVVVLIAQVALASYGLSTVGYLPVIYKEYPPPTPTPRPGWLLISEVLYDPDGDEPDGEWVEVYNAGDMDLDLSVYKIGDEEINGGREGMFQFPHGSSIAPGEVLIIAYRAITFSSVYSYTSDFEFSESDPNVLNMVKYSTWSGGRVQLKNSGDEVLAINELDEVVDAVSWGDSNFAFIPSVPRVAEGHSLERYPANVDTDSAADWRDQAKPAPGQVDLASPVPTPVETATPVPTLVFNEIHADPDSAHGDANGDGVLDVRDDEFLEIVNVTGSTVDLSGWTLNDLVGVHHTFPAGTLIDTECAIVVFGGGEPSGDFGGSLVQTASGGILSLNNGGDSLTLYDLGVSEVLSYTYGSEGGDDQSLTRDPDIIGPDPLVKHSTATGSGGALFSPGTRIDGAWFDGCSGN